MPPSLWRSSPSPCWRVRRPSVRTIRHGRHRASTRFGGRRRSIFPPCGRRPRRRTARLITNGRGWSRTSGRTPRTRCHGNSTGRAWRVDLDPLKLPVADNILGRPPRRHSGFVPSPRIWRRERASFRSHEPHVMGYRQLPDRANNPDSARRATHATPAESLDISLVRHEAEEAAKFYTSLFDDARITSLSRYGKGAPMSEGAVLTVHRPCWHRIHGAQRRPLGLHPFAQIRPMRKATSSCSSQGRADRALQTYPNLTAYVTRGEGGPLTSVLSTIGGLYRQPAGCLTKVRSESEVV